MKCIQHSESHARRHLVAKALSEDGGEGLLRKTLQELGVAEGWKVWGALHSMQHEGRCHHRSSSNSRSPDHCRRTTLCVAMLQQELQRLPRLQHVKTFSLSIDCDLGFYMQLEEGYWCSVHAGEEGYLKRHWAIAGRRANGLPEGTEGQQERAGELAKVVPQRSAVRCCGPRSSRRRIASMGVQQPVTREHTLHLFSLPARSDTKTNKQTPTRVFATSGFAAHMHLYLNQWDWTFWPGNVLYCMMLFVYGRDAGGPGMVPHLSSRLLSGLVSGL